MKAVFTLSLALGVLSFSMTAFATGTGGGGDVVVLPNDQIVLADPFLDSGAPQPNNMPPLRALNPRILQAIALYSKAVIPVLDEVAPSNRSDIKGELDKLSVRDNNLRFYAVQTPQELAVFCAPGGRKSYTLPDGASVQSVACTAGDETFLVEPIFLKLSLRDQALLLIHERLTTLRDKYGGKNYSAIARFTSGMNIYLNVAREQSYQQYRILSDNETKRLTDLYIAAEEIERRNSDVTENSFMMIAHSYGGGRVHSDSMISPQALVTLKSHVGQGSVLEAGVQIYDSNLDKNERIGTNTIIRSSALGSQVTVGANTQINSSTINDGNIGASSLIDNSVLKGNSQIGENVSLRNAYLASSILDGANKVANTGSNYIIALLSRGASLQNIQTSSTINLALGSGAMISDSNLGPSPKANASKVNIVLGSMSSVKNSKLFSNQWTSGENAQIEASTLSVDIFSGGNNLKFKNASINASSINVGDDQQLVDGKITNDSLNCAPKGYSLKPLNIQFATKEYASEVNDDAYWKKFNGSFYVTTSKNIVVKADYTGEGTRQGIFSSTFKVKLDPMKIQMWVTSLVQENTDESLYTVWNRTFTKAGINTVATVNSDLPIFLLNIRSSYWVNTIPLFYNGVLQALKDNNLEIINLDERNFVITFKLPVVKGPTNGK